MNKQFLDSVQGTVLEDILNFNGEFLPPPQKHNQPPKEGEEVIGELNYYEKVVHALLVQGLQKLEEAIEAHNAVEHDHGSNNPLCANAKKWDKRTDLLETMLWDSVEARLGFKPMAIRENNQIVSRPAGESGRRGIGIGILGMGGGELPAELMEMLMAQEE